MQRRMVAVLVLGGIWLAGGVGGRLMSQGGRVRPRAATARRTAGTLPVKIVSEACPVVDPHPEVGCDSLVTSGD